MGHGVMCPYELIGVENLVLCLDDFEGLSGAASFPRKRESREVNLELLLAIPGCQPSLA